MRLKKELVPVIADMEYLIGKECYNPNSYDGWNDVEGCDFRYPVTLRFPPRDRFIKCKDNITLQSWREIENSDFCYKRETIKASPFKLDKQMFAPYNYAIRRNQLLFAKGGDDERREYDFRTVYKKKTSGVTSRTYA